MGSDGNRLTLAESVFPNRRRRRALGWALRKGRNRGEAETMTCLPEGLLLSLRAGVPPNVALMQIILRVEAPEEVTLVIESALRLSRSRTDPGRSAEVMQVLNLWHRYPDAWGLVRSAGWGHATQHSSPQGAVKYWSERYDWLARENPETSVALYSLGDPELLNAATAEVVSFLRGLQLFGPCRRLLDMGCGIGRLLAPLAAEVGSATGIDISAEMVERAKGRCQSLSNVSIKQCSGLDLAEIPNEGFDVVLAADVLPYVFEAGPQLMYHIFRELVRVLVSDGTMVLLNYSYRADPESDCADIASLADEFKLELIQSGCQPFKLWDGLAFVLKKTDISADRVPR
jgi:cyclopropane fatty-acyl-phospholipid synthase-like methyltransferase